MITPEEIKKRAQRIWQSQALLRAELNGIERFPLQIPFRHPTAKDLLERFGEIRDAIVRLRQQSKPETGFGYSLGYKEINHRSLGRQSVVDRIFFESAPDFYRYIGRQRDHARWKALSGEVTERFPELRTWIEKKPLQAIELGDDWQRFLGVIGYLQRHPRPGLYVRQLPIGGLDTKFIERNKQVLRELLDLALPENAIDSDSRTLSGGGFEKRFGFRYDEPRVRWRQLDPVRRKSAGYSDLEVPLSEFATHEISCETVFITENKVNFLAFPEVESAIIVFGGGYGVGSLKDVEWFRNRTLFYWGDIDTHGFSVLSRLRGCFDHLQSFLMDDATLMACESLWGEETEAQRCLDDLLYLTPAENELFMKLRENKLGKNIRLEQERISFETVIEKLAETNLIDPNPDGSVLAT